MKFALAGAMLLALTAASASASAQPPYAGSPDQPPPTSAPADPGAGYGGTAGAPAYGSGQGAGAGQGRGGDPAMRAARRALRQACAADVQRLCANAQASGQRPMQCLRSQMSQVSPSCVQAFQALRAARQSGGGAPPAGAPQGGYFQPQGPGGPG